MVAKKRTLKKIPKKPGETGRKLLAIDEDEVRRLGMIGCTDRDISVWFGCDEQTIANRFSDILAKAREGTRQRLRKKQLEMALNGDRTMLIWLGKQMLGQQEPPSVAIQNNVSNTTVVAAKQRTKEEDKAFLEMEAEVNRKRPPLNGDALGHGAN
jgi:hypothetical protein